MNKSKERIELEIGKKIAEFLKEQIGEKTEDVITRIMEDTIMVKLKEALPPAERQLMREPEGIRAVKELKEKLIEGIKPRLENIIKELTDSKVINSHSSIDSRTGDRIILFSIEENLEEKFQAEDI